MKLRYSLVNNEAISLSVFVVKSGAVIYGSISAVNIGMLSTHEYIRVGMV